MNLLRPQHHLEYHIEIIL